MKQTLIAAILLLLLAGLAGASHVTEVRMVLKHSDASWEAGHTSVSDLSIAEKRALCGAKIDYSKQLHATFVHAPEHVSSPPVFNWHDINGSDWMTPVRNQGSCGSCWAFGAIGAVEACCNILKNDPDYDIDLSEQHLTSSCCSAGSCKGGYPTGALGYIKNNGVPVEKCFPYRAKNSACTPCDGWENDSYKISNYVHIDVSDYKWALEKYGPMVVVIRVPDDWFYYKAGVYEPVWEGKVGWANHCVVLCGWNDSENAWIIKNSWGKYWGMDGYAYVKYGVLEQYNYGYAIEKPITPSPPPEHGTWIKPSSATASSMYSGAYSPEKAIDADNKTHWYSKRYQKNNWIQLEMNKTAVVDAIRMRIYPSFVPMPVKVQMSTDNKNWKTVADTPITKGYTLFEIPFEKNKCRYLRIIERKQYYGLAMLTEMDVHVCKEDVAISSINLEYANGSTRAIPFDNNLVGITIISNNTKTLEWWNT